MAVKFELAIRQLLFPVPGTTTVPVPVPAVAHVAMQVPDVAPPLVLVQVQLYCPLADVMDEALPGLHRLVVGAVL